LATTGGGSKAVAPAAGTPAKHWFM
jgi:hypothetical protein